MLGEYEMSKLDAVLRYVLFGVYVAAAVVVALDMFVWRPM